jgi:hypothetical protein
MDMGSLDWLHCGTDLNGTMWLPLLENTTIVEQPVNTATLAPRYAAAAAGFVRSAVAHRSPFFLYMPFSHMHQLCPPASAQWASSVGDGCFEFVAYLGNGWFGACLFCVFSDCSLVGSLGLLVCGLLHCDCWFACSLVSLASHCPARV